MLLHISPPSESAGLLLKVTGLKQLKTFLFLLPPDIDIFTLDGNASRTITCRVKQSTLLTLALNIKIPETSHSKNKCFVNSFPLSTYELIILTNIKGSKYKAIPSHNNTIYLFK